MDKEPCVFLKLYGSTQFSYHCIHQYMHIRVSVCACVHFSETVRGCVLLCHGFYTRAFFYYFYLILLQFYYTVVVFILLLVFLCINYDLSR